MGPGEARRYSWKKTGTRCEHNNSPWSRTISGTISGRCVSSLNPAPWREPAQCRPRRLERVWHNHREASPHAKAFMLLQPLGGRERNAGTCSAMRPTPNDLQSTSNYRHITANHSHSTSFRCQPLRPPHPTPSPHSKQIIFLPNFAGYFRQIAKMVLGSKTA